MMENKVAAARSAPPHGYTVATITNKRFRENTSATAILIGFALPYLNAVNKELEGQLNKGEDVSNEGMVQIFKECGITAGCTYAERCARVGCQTTLACALIAQGSATGNSMVYLWDLYPRLHYRYIGDVLRKLYIPKFIISLLGPVPTEKDVAFLTADATAFTAFQDSVKRNSVILFGDIIVDTGRLMLLKQKSDVIARQAATRTISMFSCAGGAAAGRLIGGERGEYFGEIVGMIIAPLAVRKTLTLVSDLRARQRHASKSRSSSSRKRSSSASGSKPSAARSAPAPAGVANMAMDEL